MIIRKKNIPNKKTSSSSSSKVQKGSVIKKEDLILDVENVQNTNTTNENILPSKMPEKKADDLESFEKIDISSIEFKERVERRRGDRRRGYRRIDERTLVSRAQNEAHTIKELAAREGYKNGFSQAQNQLEEMKKQMQNMMGMDEKQMEKVAKGQAPMPMPTPKKSKGKGKNRGGFRI